MTYKVIREGSAEKAALNMGIKDVSKGATWSFGKEYFRQKGRDQAPTCRTLQSLCSLLRDEKLLESSKHNYNRTFDLKELLWLLWEE